MLKFFYQQMHFYLTYKIIIIKIYVCTPRSTHTTIWHTFCHITALIITT